VNLFDEQTPMGVDIQSTERGSGTTDEHPISVLHVDQSETPDLETTQAFQDTSISVERATTAADAVSLLETGTFDCVITEYDLPNTTGVKLRDVVREKRSDLPIIFFTTDELGTVPASCVGPRLTDYLQKTSTKQYTLLANRIRDLTDQYQVRRTVVRNREEFEQNRELFELVVGTAPIFLWDWDLESGTLQRYPNTRQLFGIEKTELEPVFGTFTEYIHSDHRDDVVNKLETAIENNDSYQVQYELEIPDSQWMWIEEYGTVLTNDGTASRAVGASVDITPQKERERELRWNRDLNRTLHEALIESRTRANLEQRIVEQLHGYRYDLAWIGDVLVDEIKPRATAGRTEYVDALDLSVPDTAGNVEPIVRAVSKETTQYVDDLRTGDRRDWQDTANEWGFQSAAALPLVYSDMFYGVLAVYDDESGVFDRTARRLLSELADTLAFVVHNIERKNSLASDRVISATLQLVGADYYLSDLIRAAECDTRNTRIMVHETLPYDDHQNLQYVSVDGTSVDVIADAATTHPVVSGVTRIGSERNRRLQIQHCEQTPESTLTNVGARIRSTSITAKRTDVLIEVPNRTMLRRAIENLEASNEFVSVLSSIERDRSAGSDANPLTELTDRQRTVLQAAYHRGYFEQPRESSAKAVAQSLGISHPTFLEHLRLAQQTMFQSHFE